MRLLYRFPGTPEWRLNSDFRLRMANWVKTHRGGDLSSSIFSLSCSTPSFNSRSIQNGRSTNTPEGSFKARAGSKAVREVGYARVRAIWIAPRHGPKRLTALHFSVEVKDISLTDYIQIRHAVYLPHTAGRYAKKQFKKAQMPIVERLVDRLVMILPQHHSC